jgi:hypothetical protein
MFAASQRGGKEMFANGLRTKVARGHAASLAVGAVLALSACGATVAAQSQGGQSDRVERATEAQGSAGASSLDYDTAKHIGRLETSAGSFLLDYDTAKHMGRIDAGVIAP